MKRFAFAILIIAAVSIPTQAKYSGGSGDPNDPYQIGNAEDLNDIGNHPEDFNKYFIQTSDINLAQYTGSQFNIIADRPSGGRYTKFTGIFEGNSYTIKNLHLDSIAFVGLFGYIGSDGVVKNVRLEGIDINGVGYVGGVAGRNEGLIQNCHVSGIIAGEQSCGGITGYCGYVNLGTTKIINCSFTGQVRGTLFTGGIVGSTDMPEIVNCYAIAEIIGQAQCGGIVGHNMGGNFQSCFAKGAVTCSQSVAGGFAGVTYDHCGYGGDICDCYADVTVNCSSYAGGFSGSYPGQYGEIRNCYCSGRVAYDRNTYEDVGGFIGEDRSTPQGVYSSYFLETAGPDNGAGEPLTDARMKQQSSFVGWDFNTPVWTINEGVDYPHLCWENTASVADASPDQTVYAWIDGLADVTLDGSASYDPDGDELAYFWWWTIDGNDYEANGVNPTIELPVGEHKIELVVNDGFEDSEPNYTTVTVIGPIKGFLWLAPQFIFRQCPQRRILTKLLLPAGITRDQIDTSQKLTLYPGGIEATNQIILPCYMGASKRLCIFAYFDRDEVLDAIGGNRLVRVYAVGKLKTGQYFYGTGLIRIFNPGHWPRWGSMRNWFRTYNRLHPCTGAVQNQ